MFRPSSWKIKRSYRTGCCHRCGSKKLTTRWHCKLCRIKMKTTNKIRYDRLIKDGLCTTCGRRKTFGKKLCPKCSLLQQQKNTEATRRLKVEVIQEYGGKCVCCSESHFEFLQIDHIHGNGRAHRKKIRGNIYSWLKRNGFPKDRFQLLCSNCNFSKGRYGYCPHKKAENSI